MEFLDLAMLALLCGLFYYQYKRTGLLFLPSNAWLLISIILAMFVAYPLATSPESLADIGQVQHFRTIQWGVDEALVIVTVGILCAIFSYVVIGFLFGRSVRWYAKTDFVPRTLSMDDFVLGANLTAVLALGYVFYSYYRAGSMPLLSSNPLYWRTALAKNVGGSFYLGALAVSSVAVTFLMAALALRKVRSYRLLTLAVVGITCFSNFATSSRGTFLGPFVGAGLIYFSAKQKKLTLPRALAVCAGILVLAAGLQAFRYRVGLSLSGTEFEILHGNTFFSNFRDSGWTLAYFELGRYDFLHGKTILAGLLGFLPHDQRSFRSQYRWGTFALGVVGSDDPNTHYGLAHVYFVDWYVNFAYWGVIAEGILAGLIMRFIDERLLYIRRRGKTLREFDCYRAFRVWTWATILEQLISSALAPFAYPTLGALIAIGALSAASHKVTEGLRAVAHVPAPRERPNSGFNVGIAPNSGVEARPGRPQEGRRQTAGRKGLL